MLVLLSCSQMFQRPVQAAIGVVLPATVMVAVLAAGRRIAKTIFLPSSLTSGSLASPTPGVKRAVRLCSVALGLDFPRSVRSPTSAVGVPSVVFIEIYMLHFR